MEKAKVLQNRAVVGLDFLKQKAKEVRKKVIQVITNAKSGHPGGSLSYVEIAVWLFYKELNINPQNPWDPDRDRFVLAKGHGIPTVYVIMADLGYFPEEELWRLRRLGGILQGHPERGKPPGIEVSTGSLGLGTSVACGMALYGKMEKKNFRVFVVAGEGDLQEGQTWEALMSAAHYKLDNLCLIVDNNQVQTDGFVSEIMEIEPIEAKFKAFGWETMTIDGHDFLQIEKACNFFKSNIGKGKPTAIIAKTVKGKGVSFMEYNKDWHGVAPTPEQAQKAIEEIEKNG